MKVISKKYLYYHLNTLKLKKKQKIFRHLEKLITILIKCGKKIKIFFIIYNILCLLKNLIKKKKNQSLIQLLIKLFYKIRPTVRFITFYKSGKKYILPFYATKITRFNLGIRWFLNSIKIRTEKTLFLRILSEFKDLKAKKGLTIKKKKESYNLINNNKYLLSFLKQKHLKKFWFVNVNYKLLLSKIQPINKKLWHYFINKWLWNCFKKQMYFSKGKQILRSKVQFFRRKMFNKFNYLKKIKKKNV